MKQDYYQVHGSVLLWDWLKTIVPCVEILQRLATNVHTSLGSKQGQCHTAPDLTEDIKELMGSLTHHSVYTEQQGHVFNNNNPPAPNVIVDGYTSLSWGGTTPLKQFNNMFMTLQCHHHVKPLVEGPESQPNATAPKGCAMDSAPFPGVFILWTLVWEQSVSLTDDFADANVTVGDDNSGGDVLDDHNSMNDFSVPNLNEDLQADLDLTSMEDVALNMDGYIDSKDEGLVSGSFAKDCAEDLDLDLD